MRTTLVLILLGAASLATGCGSSSPTPSDGGTGGTGGAGGGGGSGNDVGTTTHCDVNNAGTQTCIEYAPDYTPSRAAGCTVLTGTYSTGACSQTNSSGGCKQSVTTIGTQTTYYYMPTITPAAVMTQCTNDGNATYVAP